MIWRLRLALAKRRVDPEPLGGPLDERRMAEVERAVLLAIGIVSPPCSEARVDPSLLSVERRHTTRPLRLEVERGSAAPYGGRPPRLVKREAAR